MVRIFDTHAHYDDAQFDGDRETLLQEMQQNGVVGILNMSSDYASIATTVKLVEDHAVFYGACGIHPSHAQEYNEAVRGELDALLEQERFVAVGEIGLDYYWASNPSKEVQQEVLRAQYALAGKHSVPVILHDREAHGDILAIAKEFPEVTSVFHAFSGSVEMAREVLALGGYIGIGGVVTFKNAKKLPDVVRMVPMDRLLLETDAPYLAPSPYRGKRNRSDYLLEVAAKVAELKGLQRDEVLESTYANARRLFRLETLNED